MEIRQTIRLSSKTTLYTDKIKIPISGFAIRAHKEHKKNYNNKKVVVLFIRFVKNQIISTKYKATTTEEAYFITITTVGWIDFFTRLNQKYNFINSLYYCQQSKGLEIYAYVIISNHVHLMCKATNGFILSDVIRDFKKFISKKILKTCIQETESRR